MISFFIATLKYIGKTSTVRIFQWQYLFTLVSLPQLMPVLFIYIAWLNMYVCCLLQQYSQISFPPFKLSKSLDNKVLNLSFKTLFTRFIILKTPTQIRSKSSLLNAKVIPVLVATKKAFSLLIKLLKKVTQFSTTNLLLCYTRQ